MGITGSWQEEGLEGREPPAPPCSWSLWQEKEWSVVVHVSLGSQLHLLPALVT